MLPGGRKKSTAVLSDPVQCGLVFALGFTPLQPDASSFQGGEKDGISLVQKMPRLLGRVVTSFTSVRSDKNEADRQHPFMDGETVLWEAPIKTRHEAVAPDLGDDGRGGTTSSLQRLRRQ
jgi:hypothetical protein